MARPEPAIIPLREVYKNPDPRPRTPVRLFFHPSDAEDLPANYRIRATSISVDYDYASINRHD
jgi:hypothetical protein